VSRPLRCIRNSTKIAGVKISGRSVEQRGQRGNVDTLLFLARKALLSGMERIPSVRGALTIATATILLTLSAFSADSTFSPESFTRLHSLIKPKASEETWIRIPWMTGLWEARQRAAAEGKPILLWEMDGHPLGCT
jgi:hypothetical protein